MGTLAATYKFDSSWWSPDDLDEDASYNEVTPPPTLAWSNWPLTGHIMTGPTEYRFANPYNASSKTCCERKKVGNNANSCPWSGSNANRNWYVPVPSGCAGNTLTRAFKNTVNSGGFLS